MNYHQSKNKVGRYPIGCPSATAPPQTFTFLGSNPRILLFARLTAENAYPITADCWGSTSLISHFAMSLISRPARFNAMGIAKLGAMVKSIGLVAVSPQDRILAMGFVGNDFDFSRVVSTNADAPSLIADALAAVTVPSFLFINGSCLKGILEYRFESRNFFKF